MDSPKIEPQISLFKAYPALIAVLKIEAPLTSKEEDIKKAALDYLKKEKILGVLPEKLSLRTSSGKIPIHGLQVWFVKLEMSTG